MDALRRLGRPPASRGLELKRPGGNGPSPPGRTLRGRRRSVRPVRGALFPRTRQVRHPARGARRRALGLHARGPRPLDRRYGLGRPGRTRSHRRRHPRATGGPPAPSGAWPETSRRCTRRRSGPSRTTTATSPTPRRTAAVRPWPDARLRPRPGPGGALCALSAGVPHPVAGPPCSVNALAPFSAGWGGLLFSLHGSSRPAYGRASRL